jgi:hypothetical protein
MGQHNSHSASASSGGGADGAPAPPHTPPRHTHKIDMLPFALNVLEFCDWDTRVAALSTSKEVCTHTY